ARVLPRQRGAVVLDRRRVRHLGRAGGLLMLRFRHRTAGGTVDAVAESPDELVNYDLARPVDPPEVWGAGVTYRRSLDARMEESAAQDLYARVYGAERPELFLKDAACRRTGGPGEPIGVRAA